MRVAAVYDIHGNLPALEAVLAEVRIDSWPPTVGLEIPGLGGALFCHATPRDDNELFTRRTPESRLLPVFADAGAAVVVCGRTHIFERAELGR